jgi:hypothetical protein
VGAPFAVVAFGISHGVVKCLDDLGPSRACLLSICAISFPICRPQDGQHMLDCGSQIASVR